MSGNRTRALVSFKKQRFTDTCSANLASVQSSCKTDVLETLATLVRDQDPQLRFTLLNVGAVPLGEQQAEPFYSLIDLFPGTRVIGFELEESVCNAMNAMAQPGETYFPIALGAKNESRTLYVTEHPMCCSLYEPNEPLLRLFTNLRSPILKQKARLIQLALTGFAKSRTLDPLTLSKLMYRAPSWISSGEE